MTTTKSGEKVEAAIEMVKRRADYADAMADMLKTQDPELSSEHTKSADQFRTILASHADLMARVEKLDLAARNALYDLCGVRGNAKDEEERAELAETIAQLNEALLSGEK